MKKSIVKLGLVTALSASLFGFTYEIKQGWQQLGALEDLNSSDLSAFNDKCVNYLWFYDNNDSSNPQWKLHIANGNDYDYCGETLTSLKKGQGFWANAKADCNISIGTIPDKPCVSDMPAPPDLEKPECMTCDTSTSTSGKVFTPQQAKDSGIFIVDPTKYIGYLGSSGGHDFYRSIVSPAAFDQTKTATIKTTIGSDILEVSFAPNKVQRAGYDFREGTILVNGQNVPFNYTEALPYITGFLNVPSVGVSTRKDPNAEMTIEVFGLKAEYNK